VDHLHSPADHPRRRRCAPRGRGTAIQVARNGREFAATVDPAAEQQAGSHRAAMRLPGQRSSGSQRAYTLACEPAIGRALLPKEKTHASLGWNGAAVVIIVGAAALSIGISPDARGLLGAALALLMGAIAVSDLRNFIVPNAATAPAFALALMHSLVTDPTNPAEQMALVLLRALVLALVFLALRAAYRRWRGRDGLGLGDVKLAGVAGA